MKEPQLVEVWGDTVDMTHLAWSIVLGIAISLGAYFVANHWLASVVADPARAKAYAMLVGLGGCLVAGVVCGTLFKPKREVVEQTFATREREQVLAELAAEAGGLGRVADLPAAVAAEMRELGLYDVFADYERRTASRGDGVVAIPARKEGVA